MALYTVHIPSDAASDVERADRAVFVRDGFNRWGLVFGGLFLLRYRLWAALLIGLVLGCAAALLWSRSGLTAGPLVLLALLAHVFIGVEGNDLRRWALEGRRFNLVDVVSASRREDAEYAFFLRQPDEESIRPISRQTRLTPPDMTPAVIGMFPDSGAT